MLRKVISGGQTGADRSGLFAALYQGYETGGWIPKGWKTERGPMPKLADFGLVETESSDYAERTELNVIEADATLIIAMNQGSKGTILTQKLVDKHKKYVAGIKFFTGGPADIETTAQRVAEWIVEHEFEVLNIAGNRESVAPGIQSWSTQMLSRTFEIVKGLQSE